ncbi:VCBS repeat-containing protein [Fulvivirgaceae bacterium PWU5]|uniref:VCBS repeat-containing protein n=1 Tax=Dawidia cretensis TaxID=2782350 RepID=A0AAP2GNT2_9BACT|nr:FG-GAP-like repeat-containing protein [Dawidia cretensis]MBT1707534.1 VCBS repeat-containing protein [Dawidia cretensis]
MKQALVPTVKTSLLAGFFLLLVTTAWAQRPVIQGVEQVSGSTGQLVLIKGTSFGGDKTKLQVRFGATPGMIESATDQTIKVRVPAGTTYRHLSVTNLTSHLTAFSPNPFLLSFSGEHPFTAASLDNRQDFSADKGIEDICLCDLNNDGLPEVITTHNGVNTLSIHRNTSTPGTLAMSRIVLPAPGFSTLSLRVKCGDLNGDGWPDLVVTGTGNASAAEKIFVLQSSGGSSFSVIPITISGWAMADVEINDIDMDGRPDLVISNQTANYTLGILRNTSVGTAISFNDAPVVLTATPDVVGGPPVFKGTNALALQDLNGDGLPEILISLIQEPNHNNLWIFPNQSHSGVVSFSTVVKHSLEGVTVQSMRVGDLDGDGKSDVAFNSLIGGTFVLRNTSTGSSFSFASRLQIGLVAQMAGIDFGDIDGDGKTDIVIAHQFNKTLTILDNNSAPGALFFSPTVISTPLLTTYVRVGDMDGDGKPDIVFPGADATAPLVSILRNKHCVLPKIEPEEDITLCAGTHILTATQAPGAYYDWKKDGVTVACGKELYSYTINPPVTNAVYTVTIRTEGGASCTAGSCALTSESVTVTILGAGGLTLTPSVSGSLDGKVCKDTDIILHSGGPDDGSVTYSWTGPGYSHTTTSEDAPPFPATGAAQAGEYTVEATRGGCVAGRGTIVVEVIEMPATSFKIRGPTTIVACPGDADITLQLDEAPAAFTYAWYKEGNATSIGSGPVSPAIVPTNAAASGDYYVKASSPGCGLPVDTDRVKVTITTKPVVSFTTSSSDGTVCKDQRITFTSTSTTTATPVYQWNFDVSGAGTQGPNAPTAETSYSNTGPKTVRLSIHYGSNACLTKSEQPITVTLPPGEVVIENPDGLDAFCEGETLLLEASSPAAIKSYLWSTGETTASINVPDGGTYTVDIAFSTGSCVITKSKQVTQLPAPEVIITGTPERINEGESAQLTASGLDTYQWTPAESLSNAAVPNPVAQPVATTEYTVTGVGANECPGSGTFIVQVVGEAIVNKLNPHNFFSPNNDGPNEQWQVDEILTYAQCGVTVYDDKGVKVFEAKPYHNDWNGTFNGKQLPDGVYFYIIRCDGEESTPRAGSITLLR